VFLESETLLSSPRHVLDQLSVFLELDEPLKAEYRRFPHTGELGFGDPSEAIRIVPAQTARTVVSLPRPLTSRLQNAYDFWCAAIRKSCPMIDPGAAELYAHDERSGR